MAKKTARYAAREVMQTLGYDPMEQLIHIAKGENVSADTRKDIALAMMPYIYPKLANVEVQGEMETTINAPNSSDLLKRLLSNPDLADAAQKLSLEAADLLNEGIRPN